MDALPYSQACENNKQPILDILSQVFADRREVLEIASGTGQHATWFAEHLPHLRWRPSEMPNNLSVLMPRCEHYAGNNLGSPTVVDVSQRPWMTQVPHALFSANSLHIMPWASVEDFFSELGERAQPDTILAIYGPFNYGGEYTSESNARFDQWLAAQNPHSAIRNFEDVEALANEAGFKLESDNEMPANNRLLVWRS